MLKSISVLQSNKRNQAIDIFRALAIVAVVLFHFDRKLATGYLGVDLFFVISGILVGGRMIEVFSKGEKVNFWKFVLQRGFKIWPSYFAFLLIGIPLAYLLYRNLSPSELIEPWELKKYLLFYKNYDMLPTHSSFDQVWSLCVEEHFYLLMPIGFLILYSIKANKHVLFGGLFFIILLGIAGKMLDRYVTAWGTHSRVDAFAWGMLFSAVLTYYPNVLHKVKKPVILFLGGLVLFAVVLVYKRWSNDNFFEKVMLHSAVPFCFTLMIAGFYHFNFSGVFWLRIIAYYSYNWYLWHAIFIPITVYYFGTGLMTTIGYLIFSFGVAMLFTILIEEPVLKRRNIILGRLFQKSPKKFSMAPVKSQ